MTNEELLAKIKAEIDKRYAEYREKMKTDDFTYYEGMADALDLFEQFLDTLESEKPVPADLEEAALSRMRDPDMYLSEAVIDEIGDALLKMAEFGAKWQKEQMLKEAVEGEVMTNGFYPYEPRIVIFYPGCPYEFGEKVRLVIIKED